VRALFWCATLGGLAWFFAGTVRGGNPRTYAVRCRPAARIRAAETAAVLAYITVLLLGWDFPLTPWPERAAWAGLVLAIAGVALAVWSRRTLQTNFTVTLGIKSDHRLITEGPYRRVRHPIYTGFLMQFAGGALLYNSGVTLVLLALLFCLLFYWQSVEEEKLLEQRFGDAYRRYRMAAGRLLPRLIPGGQPHG
jgi:protein-S-isoprenylcysteine O-methyltransferase Ste14